MTLLRPVVFTLHIVSLKGSPTEFFYTLYAAIFRKLALVPCNPRILRVIG